VRTTIFALALLTLAPLAHADKAAKAAAKAAKKAAKQEKKEKKENKGKLDLGGRIFARAAMVKSDGGPADLEPSIASARLKADYKWQDVLHAEIEVELRSSAKLKNALVKVLAGENDAMRADVRAGNFKLPFDAITLSSAWTLPMADRGMIDNVLSNREQVAGRRLGADVEAKTLGDRKLEVDAGVFDGTDDFSNPLSATWGNGYGLDGALRAEAEATDGITIGVAAEYRSGVLAPDIISGKLSHRTAYDLDLTVERGGLRAWAEGFTGSTWLVNRAVPGHKYSWFSCGRAIAAYRFGGRERGACFVEPYAMGGAIDPDSSYGSDLLSELAVGVSYGNWDVWRVQLEGELHRIGKNAPDNAADVQLPNQNDSALLVQLGAHL